MAPLVAVWAATWRCPTVWRHTCLPSCTRVKTAHSTSCLDTEARLWKVCGAALSRWQCVFCMDSLLMNPYMYRAGIGCMIWSGLITDLCRSCDHGMERQLEMYIGTLVPNNRELNVHELVRRHGIEPTNRIAVHFMSKICMAMQHLGTICRF